MSGTFINEAACYRLFDQYGIGTPNYCFVESIDQIDITPFAQGQQVVYKAVIDDLWHKSDLDLVSFDTFSDEKARQISEQFSARNPEKDKWRGLLICDKVAFKQHQLPSELLLSVKRDSSCGPIVTLGFGGIHTELWGKELSDGVLNFPVAIMTVDEAFKELQQHLLGKILLGNVRGGKALSNPAEIKKMLTAVWQMAAALPNENIELLEINPLVIGPDGQFIALDGVGARSLPQKKHQALPINPENTRALLHPQSIVIAGVSSKKKAFGNIILDNLKESAIPHEQITILKPGSENFEGFRTIQSLSDLAKPVDVIILAVPAEQSLLLIEEIFRSNCARIIHLVAGGIGDSADHSGLKDKLVKLIEDSTNPDRPRIIGPNSLGMILSPQRINTLFIPEAKLPVTFHPHGNVAMVAQSGAFFITRLSRNSQLPLCYGLCIGNQIDLSASDIIAAFKESPAEVIGLYLEGPPAGNALGLAQAIRALSATKKVIVYRAGRSSQGKKAAAGHTGALASDYVIEKKLLLHAGAILCERFKQFENSLKWYSAYPEFSAAGHGVSVISNAGYESVAAADGLKERLITLTNKTKEKLEQVLARHRLSGIVSPSNPFDITPMASDAVYLECCRVLAEAKETQLIIVGLVPLTVMVETEDMEKMLEQAAQIRKLSEETDKPIAIVIDAGDRYEKLKTAYRQNNLPVFGSVQEVTDLII